MSSNSASSFVSNFSEDIFPDEESDVKSQSSNSSSENERYNSGEYSSSKKTETLTEKNRRQKLDKKHYIYAPLSGQPDRRISPKKITNYEYCRLIGERAEQISKGAPVHPKYSSSGIHDLIKIAQMELDDRSIEFPLNVYRPIGNPMEPSVMEVFNPHEPNVYLPDELLVNHIEKYIPKNLWKLF